MVGGLGAAAGGVIGRWQRGGQPQLRCWRRRLQRVVARREGVETDGARRRGRWRWWPARASGSEGGGRSEEGRVEDKEGGVRGKGREEVGSKGFWGHVSQYAVGGISIERLRIRLVFLTKNSRLSYRQPRIIFGHRVPGCQVLLLLLLISKTPSPQGGFRFPFDVAFGGFLITSQVT